MGKSSANSSEKTFPIRGENHEYFQKGAHHRYYWPRRFILYDLRASCGILYNHESPRRGYEFVSRKITSNVAKIKLGLENELRLGNLEAKRDWGHAKEYVKAMWKMLQRGPPDDYVIASGRSRSVREYADKAFSFVGLNYKDYVVTDPKFYRPAEIHHLLGDTRKAQRELGWNYTVSFDQLIQEMVEVDIKMLRNKMKRL